MKGRIKKLLTAKKCGFITATDGKDYFFHSSAVLNGHFDDLRENQEVSFEGGDSQKGPRAEEVTI